MILWLYELGCANTKVSSRSLAPLPGVVMTTSPARIPLARHAIGTRWKCLVSSCTSQRQHWGCAGSWGPGIQQCPVLLGWQVRGWASFLETPGVTPLGGTRESPIGIWQPAGIFPLPAHPTINLPPLHRGWGRRDNSEAFCTHFPLQETSAAARAARGRWIKTVKPRIETSGWKVGHGGGDYWRKGENQGVWRHVLLSFVSSP